MSGPLGVTVIAYACLVAALFLAVVEAALPTFGIAGALALVLAIGGGAGVASGAGPWWPLAGLVLAAGCWTASVMGGRPGSRAERVGLAAFAGGSLLYGVLARDVPTLGVGVVASLLSARLVPSLARRIAALRDTPSVTGQQALVGRLALVEHWDGQVGRVRLEGTLWNATGPTRLRPGDMVVVEGWSGLTVLVASEAGVPVREEQQP